MPKAVSLSNYRDDKYYPKITRAVSRVLARADAVSPIEVFVEMGLLDSENVKRWNRGQIPYLERAMQCNLSNASRILRILRFHAHDLNLGLFIAEYKHKNRPLRFSKSGARRLEEAYSRHFVVIGKKGRVGAKRSREADQGSESKKR